MPLISAPIFQEDLETAAVLIRIGSFDLRIDFDLDQLAQAPHFGIVPVAVIVRPGATLRQGNSRSDADAEPGDLARAGVGIDPEKRLQRVLVGLDHHAFDLVAGHVCPCQDLLDGVDRLMGMTATAVGFERGRGDGKGLTEIVEYLSAAPIPESAQKTVLAVDGATGTEEAVLGKLDRKDSAAGTKPRDQILGVTRPALIDVLLGPRRHVGRHGDSV